MVANHVKLTPCVRAHGGCMALSFLSTYLCRVGSSCLPQEKVPFDISILFPREG